MPKKEVKTKKVPKAKKVEKIKVPKIDLSENFVEDDKKNVMVTKDGFDALVVELNDLKTRRRREVSARIKEAISFGDLSENSEYAEAKEEQAFVEGRILELERKIKNAKIITEKEKVHSEGIQLGAKVKLKNLSKGEFEEYTIVGSTEANPFEGRISNESPVGSAILDANKGDKIKVKVPAGYVEYQIVSFE